MVQALALESFISAIACLCASSYGPNIKPQTNLKENILNTLPSLDRDVLKVFINSNGRFTFHDETSRCALPQPEELNLRLYDLQLEIQKQNEQNEKLTDELEKLRKQCKKSKRESTVLEASKKEIIDLKAQGEDLLNKYNDFIKSKEDELEQLKLEHENEKAKLLHEIEKLNKQLDKMNSMTTSTTTTTTTPVPPTLPPKSKNGCLLTKKHGVSNLEYCTKQKTFCAKDVDSKHGDGWMLMSQRFDDSLIFYRDWSNYVEGFGKHGAKFEFFVGLEKIYTLTKNTNYELLFVFTDIQNQTKYAHYNNFAIGPALQDYNLKSVGTYTGDAGDSLSYHVGQKFSTFDKNNESKCSTKHTGAWWYNVNGNCHQSNLFGIHRNRRPNDFHKLNGMIWSTFHKTDDGNLLSMRMYIRPRDDENY